MDSSKVFSLMNTINSYKELPYSAAKMVFDELVDKIKAPVRGEITDLVTEGKGFGDKEKTNNNVELLFSLLICSISIRKVRRKQIVLIILIFIFSLSCGTKKGVVKEKQIKEEQLQETQVEKDNKSEKPTPEERKKIDRWHDESIKR